jgi:hypothetical protein
MFMIKKNKQEDALIHKIWFVIASKGQVAIASTVVNYFFNYLHTAFSIFVRADFVHLLVRQEVPNLNFQLMKRKDFPHLCKLF